MKKVYENPLCEVVKVNAGTILAGSPAILDAEADASNPVLAPGRHGILDDEDDE